MVVRQAIRSSMPDNLAMALLLCMQYYARRTRNLLVSLIRRQVSSAYQLVSAFILLQIIRVSLGITSRPT